jgi:Prasinovirus endonuclease VII
LIILLYKGKNHHCNNMSASRICQVCGEDKPQSAYYHRGDGGVHKQCKQCIQDKQKANRMKKKLLSNQKKSCIDCNKSKSKLDFYEINEYYHNRCIECCDGVEYVCGGCNDIKPFADFYVRNDTNKPRGECKACVLIRKQKWKSDNREHYNKQSAEYRNRPEIKIRQNKLAADWYAKPENKERKRLRYNERYYNDPMFRIKKIMKSRIRLAIKNNQKAGNTLELLGCTIKDFKEWLEYQFTPYMNWANQGSYWHMDHIKPCASFDLTKEEEQYKCFHWTNIQPMYGPDNMTKSDTYNDTIKFCASVSLGAYEFQKNRLKNELNRLGDDYFIYDGEIIHDDLAATA